MKSDETSKIARVNNSCSSLPHLGVNSTPSERRLAASSRLGTNVNSPAPCPERKVPSNANVPASRRSSNWTGTRVAEPICALVRPLNSERLNWEPLFSLGPSRSESCNRSGRFSETQADQSPTSSRGCAGVTVAATSRAHEAKSVRIMAGSFRVRRESTRHRCRSAGAVLGHLADEVAGDPGRGEAAQLADG